MAEQWDPPLCSCRRKDHVPGESDRAVVSSDPVLSFPCPAAFVPSASEATDALIASLQLSSAPSSASSSLLQGLFGVRKDGEQRKELLQGLAGCCWPCAVLRACLVRGNKECCELAAGSDPELHTHRHI